MSTEEMLAERGVSRTGSGDESFESLGLDSVARLELLSVVEQRCQVTIPERYWGTQPLRDVNHLIDVVKG